MIIKINRIKRIKGIKESNDLRGSMQWVEWVEWMEWMVPMNGMIDCMPMVLKNLMPLFNSWEGLNNSVIKYATY